MKKKLVAALLVAILASTMVFAEVTLSGDAETTFGYTFNTKVLGFTNASSAKATFSAVAKTSANEGDVYAEIKATLKIKAVTANDDPLKVESLAIDYAKIIGDGWYVGILGCMGPADLAKSFEHKDDAYVNYQLGLEATKKPAGIEVGIDNIGTFGIGLEANFSDDAASKDVLFTAKSADFEVAEGLKITAAATYNYTNETGKNSVVGGGVKVAYANEEISGDVAADVGVTLANETKTYYDVAANAAYNNIKASLYFANLLNMADVEVSAPENAIKVEKGTKNYLAAMVSADFRDFDLPFALTVLGQDLINTQYLDAKFDLYVVDGLTLTANGGYLVEPKRWHAGLKASYAIEDVGTLAGKVTMEGDDKNAFDTLKAEVSLTNTTLVSGATLKAAYESGNYLEKNATGDNTPDYGKVYVSAKIAF